MTNAFKFTWHAHEAGEAAYKAGQYLHNNPYDFDRDPAQAEAWSYGYQSARAWQERLDAEEQYGCEQLISY